MSEQDDVTSARLEQEPKPEAAAPGAFQEGEEAPPPGVLFMAMVRWGIVLAMGVAAAASFVAVFGAHHQAHFDARAQQYYCPMHPSVVQDHPGDCPICNMTLVPRSDVPKGSVRTTEDAHAQHARRSSESYFCPMHPEQTGTGPDQRCPLCGMKLERRVSPAEPELPAGLVPLELSPERVQLIGMRTAQVRRDALPSALTVVGVIAPTERAVSSVQTRFSGWLQELHVAETGQAVQRGQLLARIYSPELLSGQQELLNAKSWQRGGAAATQTSLLENARNRLILMGMDPAELAEVERTGQPHRLIEVRSPAHGYVAEKRALLGLFVQPGAELFRIVDLSHVWALVDVFERDASRLRVGQAATVSLPSYPGEVFRGKVTFVYPVLNQETRTLRARVELKNVELKLKPGMFGDVSLSVPNTPDVQTPLSIPREALVDMGEHQYVFVQKELGHFEPRSVQVGARGRDSVQIVAGLSDDEVVVTTGNFLLDSESRLRATIAGH